jgi:hypothetical protein
MSRSLSDLRRPAAAGAVLIVVSGATLAAMVLSALVASGDGAGPDTGVMFVGIPFGVVGAVILVRRPENPLGIYLSAIGILGALGQLSDVFEVYATITRPSAPGATLAAWFGEWYWIPFIVLNIVICPLVFPTGHLPSRRWRPFVAVLVLIAAASAIGGALQQQLPIAGEPHPAVLPNPIGIAPWVEVEQTALMAALLPMFFGGAIAALLSLVRRFRRSTGDQRQQIKWAVLGIGSQVVGFVGIGLLDALGFPRPGAWENLIFALLPLSMGVAILRYRLYDLDRLVSRTATYVMVTAVLVGVYLGSVVVMQALTRPVTGESDLAVALSTLIAAAAFRPVLHRVRRVIDRRFNRRRYDAIRTAASFGQGLRDQLELEHVGKDLRATVRDALAPSTVSVWLPK